MSLKRRVVREPLSKELSFKPADAAHWDDLVELFGERGACGGCWCMFWRLPRKQFEAQKGTANKRALKKIVASGTPPGILAYRGKEVIGWCAVAPRTEYGALERSRILKPVDEKPVWSISCLFVKRGYRRQGISAQLLRAAVDFARSHGAKIVEGYPTETGETQVADPFLWHGISSAFSAAGFTEVARRSPTRPIMRIQF
ncbi:MAG TPA: GNAT family N-acetyltransferase [Pyrinomonadaceae bacterium]|nr:GNAT family N-acetyltransferase [Pyrinomonadaceae bacterium]